MADDSSEAGIEPEILEYYLAYDEPGRLNRNFGPLERDRTRDIIRRFVHDPPAVVLDVGGGAGVHAVWLASQGYEVHFSDPVPRHVTQAADAARAAEVQLGSVRVGDARRLVAPDSSADAVLLFGPLYHLTARDDRLRALEEARRVLRPGGIVLAAGISRFASLIATLREGWRNDSVFTAIVSRDLMDGQHRNPTNDLGYFTTSYFHHPSELGSELESVGFERVEVLAVEGLGWLLGDLPERWAEPGFRDTIMSLIARTESEPSLLGASTHLIAVGSR